MEDLLNKGPVKKVKVFIKKFDPKLEVLVLDTAARTAQDAANSLKCEVGAIVKSLLFRAENTFLICLIAGDKRCSLNKLKKTSKRHASNNSKLTCKIKKQRKFKFKQ